ncbi:MAG: hypothetical protein JKX88_09270 [Marinicaulis sp.]|nr:hypothetical protein [Marinicaulis sp.]
MFDENKKNKAGGRSNFDHQLTASIDAAANWLSERQKPEGYWVGRLESNPAWKLSGFSLYGSWGWKTTTFARVLRKA